MIPRKSNLLSVIVFILSIPAICLSQDMQLTVGETRQLKQSLAEFDRHLQATQDIEPVLLKMSGNRWFVHQYNHLARIDTSLIPADKSILRNNPSLSRRIALTTFNFSYLLLLQFAAQPVENIEGKNFINSIPLDVQNALRQTAYGRAMLNELLSEDSHEEVSELKNESEVLDVVYSLEQAVAILRKHSDSANFQQRKERDDRFEKLKQEMSSAPKIHICNPGCGDLPEGTRTIVVNHGMFQLTFVEEDNELKLELIASRLGE